MMSLRECINILTFNIQLGERGKYKQSKRDIDGYHRPS